MLCKEVKNYISTAKGLPFFYVVGDAEYKNVLEELKQFGVSIVHMSDFCLKDDRFPSIDDLVDHFRTSDVDYRDNKYVVIGLGEYLAIKGTTVIDKELRRLKSTTLGNARAILLLRGVGPQAVKIISDDNRMLEQQRAYISDNLISSISVTNIRCDTELVSKSGFKNMLRSIEDGEGDHILASTELSMQDSLIPVHVISNAFDIVKMLVPELKVKENAGSAEQWAKLLKDLNNCDKDIASVFSKYGIDEGIFDELYEAISGL